MADFARYLLIFLALKAVPRGGYLWDRAREEKARIQWQNRTSRWFHQPPLMGQFSHAGRPNADRMPKRGRASTSPTPRCRS